MVLIPELVVVVVVSDNYDDWIAQHMGSLLSSCVNLRVDLSVSIAMSSKVE